MKTHPRNTSYTSIQLIPAALALIGSLNTELSGATKPESISASQDLRILDASTFYSAGDYQTSIATRGGVIFYAYISSSMELKIVKKDTAGAVTSAVVRTNIANDQYHVAPSIGIDRDGFIHVVGGMHHIPWIYYVSSKPYDIGSFVSAESPSFPIALPPGDYVSYAAFHNDNNGKLYLTYRERVTLDNGFRMGCNGGAVAKYDETTRSWFSMGGTSYDPNYDANLNIPNIQSPTKKMVFWDKDGPALTPAYQSFGMRMHFDLKNTLHLATVFFNSTGSVQRYERNTDWTAFVYDDKGNIKREQFEQANELGYVRLDENASKFTQASGSEITNLPITSDTAHIAYSVAGIADANLTEETPQGLGRLAFLASDPDGKPLVDFSNPQLGSPGVSMRAWNGTSWVAPIAIPTYWDREVLADLGGRLVWPRKNTGFVRSFDFGRTKQDYYSDTASLRVFYTSETVPEGVTEGINPSAAFDAYFYRMTGQLRYASMTPPNLITVNTAYFSEGANLTANGGFEMGTAGWSRFGTTTLAATTGSVGDYALQATGRAAAYHGPQTNVAHQLRYYGHGRYTLSGKVKVGGGTSTSLLATIRLKINGQWTYPSALSVPITASSNWSDFSSVIDMTWSGKIEDAYLYFQQPGSATTFPDIYLDEISLKRTGRHVIFNGDFEEGTAGWVPHGCDIDAVTGGYSGEKAARAFNRNDGSDGIMQNFLPELLAGGQGLYKARAYVKTSSTTPVTVKLTIRLKNGSTWTYPHQFTASVSNAWTLIEGLPNITWSQTPAAADLYIESSDLTTELFADAVFLQKQ